MAKLWDSEVNGFVDLDKLLSVRPGHLLFTVLAIDWERGENQRIYTSSHDAYPVGGVKPLNRHSEFFRLVVLEGVARICPDRESCRNAFFDFDLIQSLGCESGVNFPIKRDGQTVGSLNLLHKAGWYRPDMLPILQGAAEVADGLLNQLKKSTV
jgi:hypothetical protein